MNHRYPRLASRLSARPGGRAVLALLTLIPAIGHADPSLSVGAIADQMRRAETLAGSFSGTTTVSVTRIGVPVPDLSKPTIQEGNLDGNYRWYARGADWWTVKEIPLVSPAVGPGTSLNVLRNHGDQVLSYSDFRDRAGELYFAAAHLDRNQPLASVGPSLGRRGTNGPLSETLRELTDVRLSERPDTIEIDGRYKGVAAHMSVVPRYGYMATSFTLNNQDWRGGFSISKVRQLGNSWLPEQAKYFSGRYAGSELTKGMEAQIVLADFSVHGAPTREEVPPIPPGAVLGSEDNRMYRVAQDGTLIDWGRQGYKPNTPLAWGNLFVLSGAGLLLGSLSWIVFRNRRSPPRSPSVSRR